MIDPSLSLSPYLPIYRYLDIYAIPSMSLHTGFDPPPRGKFLFGGVDLGLLNSRPPSPQLARVLAIAAKAATWMEARASALTDGPHKWALR